MASLVLGISLLSLTIWLFLIFVWGQFWRSDQRLSATTAALDKWPDVCAIVPARNEADVLPQSLRSLLTQDYPGKLTVILVDDQSTDGTSTVAQQVAIETQTEAALQILRTDPLPAGWAGKLWAMHQGVECLQQQGYTPYILFTDADIAHESGNVRALVAKAEQENRDLVSLMVQLRCETVWERLLIPAFVFFFAKLYPFPWVNDPKRKMAAAAGGCILLRSHALTQAGGLKVIREALIDDCSLAAAVKSTGGNIWLGLSTSTVSLRPYTTLENIWTMVARTAFTQLHYSVLLLIGSVIGMSLVYMMPIISLLYGLVVGAVWVAMVGAITWLLMTWAYLPTIRLYRLSPLWALTLPLVALLYTLMTLDSARRHWQGKGGAWKGRVYPAAVK
ncbi:MAG: glycosyltransferase [Thermosynechococcaceae cyanobacterium]